MKIGIDARSYGNEAWTGIGRYVKNLIDQLAVIDTKNNYVLFLPPESYATFKPQNERVQKVLVDGSYYSLKEQLALPRTLAKAKVDLMHFPHFNFPLMYGGPFVMTIHDLILTYYPGGPLIKQLGYHAVLRRGVTKARHIIAVSEATKRDVQKEYQISDNKISVIYESYEQEKYRTINDADAIDNALKKYGVKKPFLMYTGLSRFHKNVEGLLRAFALLRKEFPKYQLALVGRVDNRYNNIDGVIKELNVRDHVVRTGFVDERDLPLLYNAAKVYVFPSFYEGFGLPALEAMACGTPVASSEAASLPEVGGQAAVYFDPRKPEAMAGVITKLLRDEIFYEQQVAKGFQHVRHFSWQRMVKETLAIYEQSINGHSSFGKTKRAT